MLAVVVMVVVLSCQVAGSVGYRLGLFLSEGEPSGGAEGPCVWFPDVEA